MGLKQVCYRNSNFHSPHLKIIALAHRQRGDLEKNQKQLYRYRKGYINKC